MLPGSSEKTCSKTSVANVKQLYEIKISNTNFLVGVGVYRPRIGVVGHVVAAHQMVEADHVGAFDAALGIVKAEHLLVNVVPELLDVDGLGSLGRGGAVYDEIILRDGALQFCWLVCHYLVIQGRQKSDNGEIRTYS